MPGEDVSDCYRRTAADARDPPASKAGAGQGLEVVSGPSTPLPLNMRKVFKQLDLGLDSKLRTGQKRERLPGDMPGSLELLLYLYFTKLSGINM